MEKRPFARHNSFSAIGLPSLLEHESDEHRVFGEVMRLVEAKAVIPVQPITEYAIGAVAEAYRLLQTGAHLGKGVVRVGPLETVAVLPRISTAKLSGCLILNCGWQRWIGQICGSLDGITRSYEPRSAVE